MISIIAPAYNNTEEVKVLLDSIGASDGVDFPFEVIIVDDGSTDVSLKDVVVSYDKARYIRLEKNSGAAAARNAGAKAAVYDSLLYLDSDVAIFPDTLRKAKKCFENKDVRAFIGHLDIVPLNGGFFPRYKAIMFNSWLPKEGYSTVFTPAIGGITKDTLLKCGGFDETIRGATVEYVRFSYALREVCTIYFYPDLVVRVKINPFKKALYTDFYSTMKWITMFDEYRKFDNHCTSPQNGLGRIFGFLAAVLLPVCILYGHYALWAAVFLLFLFLNRNFFTLVLRRESFLFFLGSVATYMVLAVSTVIGAFAGLAAVAFKHIKNIAVKRTGASHG